MKAIIHIDQLVTCQASDFRPKRKNEMQDLGIITDGAVVIDQGRIRAIGNTASVQNYLSQIPEEEILDARGHCVIPGFVDSHTHVLFAGSREKEFVMRIQGKKYMEILASGGGILSSRKALEEASDEEILVQTQGRLVRMMEYGTTTVEIKSGYGLSTEQEVRSLHLIHRIAKESRMDVYPTFLGAHAIPPEYKDSKSDYVNLICNEMIPCVAKKSLARAVDVFCEEGVFSLEDTIRILEAARDQNLEIRLHSDEIVALGGTELACAMGARSVDHVVAVTDKGIAALADSPTIANLLPGTSYSLMKDYAPARKMIDAGVAVSLSTDCNPGSCYTESMPMIISLACINMKMMPEEAICASTWNGACSLGVQSEVGSLENGKKADLLILNCRDYREIPYHFGVNPVWLTMKEGEFIRV